MERIDEHPVPAGPLAVRWLALDVPPLQAGTSGRVEVALENAGTASWRGLSLSYHWLDERGNPIHWDGIRTPVAAAPGETVDVHAEVRAPIPPGRYRLALDLVDEHRFWLAELGNHSPIEDVDVAPRQTTGARAHIPVSVEVDGDWKERVAAAHAEGYAAVGGSIRWQAGLLHRRVPPELEPYAPGGGRNPAFAHPLVCPSLLPPLEPNAEVFGLPAWRPGPGEQEAWLYDARIALTLRPRSDRRRG
ncbi:MAG TPA: hypothetical protein VEH52_03825 [Gaiellaceae bacterium]|nr:hypothetical protein [Gaiellaceae bacterium]